MAELKLIKDIGDLKETFKEQVKDVFSKGDKIAVKLHMGETNNPYYLKPDVIKKLVSVLNELGFKPFLFDSPVIYKGGRDTKEKYLKTAAAHGFTEENIGCPIVISDKGVNVKTKDLTIHVCKELVEAGGLLVLTHLTGHGGASFGGAIKNLAMGGVTRESKSDLHSLGKPKFVKNCLGCGTCAEVCIARCIEMKDGKAVFDLDACWGCSNCITNCPHDVLEEEVAIFDDLLAQGAQAVLSKFEKVFFVNFLTDIARKCDCCNNADPVLVEDIGVLFGKDIVAMDKASVDLVNEQEPNIFKKQKNHDPYLQINYAAELGLGEKEYDIS